MDEVFYLFYKVQKTLEKSFQPFRPAVIETLFPNSRLPSLSKILFFSCLSSHLSNSHSWTCNTKCRFYFHLYMHPPLHLFSNFISITILFHEILSIHFTSLYSIAELCKFLIHFVYQLICSRSADFQKILNFFCCHEYRLYF